MAGLADFALNNGKPLPSGAAPPDTGPHGAQPSLADFAFSKSDVKGTPEAHYGPAFDQLAAETIRKSQEAGIEAGGPPAPTPYVAFDAAKGISANYAALGHNIGAFFTHLPSYSATASGVVNKGIESVGDLLGDTQFMKNFAEASTRGKAALSGKGPAASIGDAAAAELESTLNVLGTLGLKAISGATGGIVSPSAGLHTGDTGLEKNVLTGIGIVGQGIGMMGSIGGISRVAAPLVTPAGFVSYLNQFPKVAKYAIPLIQNAAAFGVYGQLDPALAGDLGRRAERFGIDVATAPIYTALGMVKSAKYSLPSSFALGFGMAKLSGATNADALSSGIAFALLDGAGRVGQPKFVDARSTDEALKAEAYLTLSRFSGMKLTSNTSIEELQLAWRRAAFNTHPDRGGNTADFVQASTAYDFLTGKSNTYNPSGPEAQPSATAQTPHEEAQKALIEDTTKALQAGHTPEEIAAEMTKQLGVLPSKANDIVAAAAQTEHINVPGIIDTDTTNQDDIMAAVEAAQKAVQEGKAGKPTPTPSPAQTPATEPTDAQMQADAEAAVTSKGAGSPEAANIDLKELFPDLKEKPAAEPSRVDEILGELSDSPEMQQDWAEHYADEAAKLDTQSNEIFAQIQKLKGAASKAERDRLMAERDRISAKIARQENEFIDKWRARAAKITREEHIDEEVSRTMTNAETPDEHRAANKAALENPAKVETARELALRELLRGTVVDREKRMPDILKMTDTKARLQAFKNELGTGGATMPGGFHYDVSPGGGFRLKHFEKNGEIEHLSHAALIKLALDEYGITKSNGEPNRDTGGELREGQNPARSENGGAGPAERGGANQEPGGELSPGERGGGRAGARERPVAPVKNDEPLPNTFTSTAAPEGENHIPVKAEFAKAAVDYFSAVHEALGADGWEVDEGYATPKGAISLKKAFNPGGIAVAGDVGVILWKKDSDYGIYLHTAANLVDDSTINLDGLFGKGTNLMYRATRKDIKSSGFSNQWGDMTKMRPSELASVAADLVDRTEAQDHRPTEERAQEVEADAAEQRDEKNITNAIIEQVVKNHTAIDPDGEVRIRDDVPELTDEEIANLNLYTGAGGMEKKGAEGRGLLDEYYTPVDVTGMVAAVLDKLGALKSEGMHVLEPSVGTGAFLDDLVDTRAVVDAHEINPVAAAITKLKYPNATISTKPFEDRFMTERGKKKPVEATYDLVVGNPPYGEHRGAYKGMGEERGIAKYEEYFIKRALDLTKQGGHVAMVVPSGFLRSSESNTKIQIGTTGLLVDAYRLPNGAFPTTDIGTDIIVLRKRDLLNEGSDVSSLVGDSFFKEHPEKVLGTPTTRKGRYKGMEPWVNGSLEDASERFFSAIHEGSAAELVALPEGGPTDIEEAVTGTMEEIADAYQPSQYEEVRKEPEIVKEAAKSDATTKARNKKALDKNTKARIESGKKTKGRLDLATLSTASPEDAALWQYVEPTGELRGDFDKAAAFMYHGRFYNGFNYLQGDIYDKLDALEEEKGQMSKEQYARQKAALEAVKPPVQPLDRISVSPNARFVNELTMTIDGREATLAEHFLKWLDTLPTQAFGTSSRWGIRGYINNTPVRGGDKVSNEKERKSRRMEGDRLFALYLKDELPAKQQTTFIDTYNRLFNAYARPDYRAVPLTAKLHDTFVGKPLELRDVQLQGIGFLVNRGVGLLAHDVGVGKTMQGIIANAELLNRGWAKRPLIVVPNINVYNQWVREIQELIPDVRINLLANLGGDFKGDLKTLEIGDGSLSIITEEGFKRLGFRDETYADLTRDFFDVIQNPNEKKTKRAQALELKQGEEQIGKGMAGTSEDRFFEDLGFDYITVDEVHNANHIIPKAKMAEGQVSEFRAFQVQPSIYGIKTWLAAQYIQKLTGGRGFIGLSATPFTNNPLEYYSVLSLMARERLLRMGIHNVNDFMTMFMNISTELEFKANGDYVEKAEVRSFKNYQQFQRLLTEFIDFKDGVDAGVKRPERQSREYRVGQTEDAYAYSLQAQELFKDTQHAGALKAINELRAIAFSPYLSKYHDGAVPSPKTLVDNSPKLKAMATVVAQSLKDNPKAGHLIYSTIGVEYFPLLKQYFIDAKVVKPEQIEIISGATPKGKRSDIQERFNDGTLKIVLGSDAIMEGVNLQRNTTDLHILSLPWNFTSLRQIIGRAWRQGNKWPRMRVNQYFTENSVDTFLSQKLQNKEKRYEESLKFRGDELDVGDIDFDELKFDLITDPVSRVELEYKFRAQELQLEAKQKESEAAYKLRRAADLMEANQRVKKAEALAAQYDWAKPDVANAKKRLEEVRAHLTDRGIDVDAIQKEIDASDKELEDIATRVQELDTEKKKALVKAAEERPAFYEAPKTDYEAMAKERTVDNASFYQGGPLFERFNGSVSGAEPDRWPAELDRILTTDEMNAVIRAAYGQDLDPVEQAAYKTATEKYLAFVGKPSFERALSTSVLNELEGRVSTSRQFVEDLAKRQEVKKAERQAIEEALAETPGDTLNVEQFAERVVTKLIDLTPSKLLPHDAANPTEYNAEYGYVHLPREDRGHALFYHEIVYQSPIETSAGDVHFRRAFAPNYFAHVRADEVPGEEFGTSTRRIIEVQSDLFQRGRYEDQKEIITPIEQGIIDGTYEHFEGENGIGESYKITFPKGEQEFYTNDGYDVVSPAKFEALKKGVAEKQARDAELEKLAPYRNTWHERIIREEIRRAANDNMDALRFPTGDTAMYIEGLSGRMTWRAAEVGEGRRRVGGNPIKPEDLVRGMEIMPDTTGMDMADAFEYGTKVLVVTEVTGPGLFRAVPLENIVSALELDESDIEAYDGAALLHKVVTEDVAYPEKAIASSLDSFTESFDVRGLADPENPIYQFYDKEVQRYLRKIRPDLALVEDDAGITWFETKLDPSDATTPVLAFQRTPFETFKYQATSFEDAKAALEAYQKRLGVSFDVDFAHTIFTGEYQGTGYDKGKVKAFGVTYDNKITLAENVSRTTADHEMVHLIAGNLDKIPAFAGITRYDLLRAVNGGREFTANDIEALEEKLARGFEEFVHDRAQKQANIVLRFFQLLRDLLTDLFRALGRDVNVVKDFYDRLARSTGTTPVELVSDHFLDREVRYTATGDTVLDFGLASRSAGFDEARRSFFERLPEMADETNDLNADFIKRDISLLDNVLAQARDIYLKDPNQFAAAKQYEKVGDERRMKKAALDEKWSKMLTPYFKGLTAADQVKVNAVLMEGDRLGKEYSDAELRALNLNDTQAAAYKSVRLALNTAHELLLGQMAENGVAPEEIDEYRAERTGYMPHKWKYRFVVKRQEQTARGTWRTVEMQDYKNERLARKAWEEAKAGSADDQVRFVLDTLDNLEVDFFTEQRLSFEAMKTVMTNARTGDDVKKAMIEAVRNMAKEKGFGRHFIRRTGVGGYDEKSVPQLIANYFSGMDGYITKMEAGKRYYETLSMIDPRRQAKFYGWMRDAIAYDMGNTKEWESAKRMAFLFYLANDLSFLLTNATQNFTVGMGELSKYLKGGDKVVGPEAGMIKAMMDWTTGNLSNEERAAAQSLIKLGRLGGETTAEMMGFKNNPLYNEISSRFNKAMYHSTAWVEQNVNRVPAFIAARRIFIKQGMSEKDANEKALEVADDIHFRYGKQHRARFERGRTNVLFVFYHYMRSLLYQLSRDLSQQEYAAFARKMLYTAVLGGTMSLPFGQSLVAIYRAVFGAGCTAGKDGDCAAGLEMPAWLIALERGLPALSGVDLSGRVGIDLFAVSSIVQDPNNIKNYLGGVGNLVWPFGPATGQGRIPQGFDLLFQDRITDAMAKLLPDFLANPIKGYTGYEWGVRSFAGTPLQDANGDTLKYNTWEAIIRGTGFTPTRESLAWDANSKEFAAQDQKSAASTNVRRTIQGQIQRGDYAAARATQAAALAAGTISADTDYVRTVGRPYFIKNALAEWDSSNKSSGDLHRIENELITDVYGDKPTDQAKNTIRKDFAVYRAFGLHDKTVNDLMGASTNAEKVDILKAAKERMSPEEFAAFYRAGRKTVSTEAGNESAILISDQLDDLFHGRTP